MRGGGDHTGKLYGRKSDAVPKLLKVSEGKIRHTYISQNDNEYLNC